MKFGPAEMAQMMDAAKALITVMLVSSVGIGIVLGAIVALYHIFFGRRAADQSFQSGMPTVPAQEIDATQPHSRRSPVPRASNPLRPVELIGIIILIAFAGGGFFISKRLDFEAAHNNQLGIQPLPPTPIEPQQQAGGVTFNQPGIQSLPPTIEPQQQLRCRAG